MAVCPITERMMPAGYYVHPSCAEDFVRIGESLITGIVSDAQAVRDKQASPGKGEGSASVAGPRLLIRPTVFYPVEEAEKTLRVWAFVAMQFIRPEFRMDVYRLSWNTIGKLFIKHASDLCKWVDAAKALDECQGAINRCMKVVEPHEAEKVIKCPTCEGTSYYSFDLDHLVCKLCGELIERRNVMDSMWEQALDKLMPLETAKETVRMMGYKVADATVRSWITRGKLKLEPGRKTRPRDIMRILDKVQR